MKTDKKRINPFLLIIFFSLLLVAGINSGEVSAVLETATRICLSCIGIG
ncbi:MAG: CD1871A family CXXC motif-containing protein [Desulfobacterales bacterium]